MCNTTSLTVRELKDKGSSAGTASGGTLSGANGVASGGISGAFSGALSGAVSLAAGFVNNSSKGSVAAATALLQADAAPPRPLDDSERMLTMQVRVCECVCVRVCECVCVSVCA